MTRPAWADKGSRHTRGYGHAWTKLREQAMVRDKRMCQPCKRNGKTTPAREVDHVIPKAQGGKDRLSNVQAICIPCHKAKTQREAAEAQGVTLKDRPTFDARGRVEW